MTSTRRCTDEDFEEWAGNHNGNADKNQRLSREMVDCQGLKEEGYGCYYLAAVYWGTTRASQDKGEGTQAYSKYRGRTTSRGLSTGKEGGVGLGYGKSHKRCHNCKVTGHLAKDCPYRKTEDGAATNGTSTQDESRKGKTIVCFNCKTKGH